MRGVLPRVGRLLLGLLLLSGLSLCSGCVLYNRIYVPPALEAAQFVGPEAVAVAGRTIRVTSWNVGYAGMGAESDFVADMGEQYRPLSADLVERNLSAIEKRLPEFDADIVAIQEAARPSWNTYGIDVLGGLGAALPEYGMSFGADIDTRFVPPPLNIMVGNATFSRFAVASAERRGLPLEDEFELGLFRAGYRMHILRLEGPEKWVIVNIHLAAFDEAESGIREKQLQAVLSFAQAEFAAGHHVAIAGDWNMRLASTTFPHTTEDKYLFWVRDLPPGYVQEGWHWAVDPARPTVRTANKPYVEGENYRLIIDGLLVSPNVSVASVRTTDLNFVNADHNPVTATLIAR